MKYILIFEYIDYPDNGGGLSFQLFNDKEDMDKRVNNLAEKWKDRFRMCFAGAVTDEYEYKPIDYVREYRRERKNDS